jgi:hypothetical protein
MIRVRARSARARMALAACALWLAGVEVMPALHEAMHAQLAPHRHDYGSIVSVSFEDTTHRHPDGTIHFVAPRARTTGKAPRDHRPHATDGATHADGLAHHAAALAPVLPPATQPLPIDRRPHTVAVARSVELITRDPVAATARGPPATA